MPLHYETVIFDLDGTLLKSAAGVVNAMSYALRALDRSFPPGFDTRRVIGPPLHHSFSGFFGLSDSQTEEAVRLYREYYGVTGAFEAEYYPGVQDLLSALRAAGSSICMATTKYSLMTEKIMDHFGLRPFIRFAAMNDGTERFSTKQRMIAAVLEHCGAAPDKAVMIGDTRYDAEGARQAGVPFIGVLYGYGSREEMEKEGAARFAPDVDALRAYLFE